MRFAVALTAALLILTGTAQAAGPPLGPDGETAPTYDYASAIRQRVLVQTGVDQDGNGVNDKLAIDIIRPNAPGPFPAIIDASPYFTSLCRGLESECMGDPSGDGVNDRWPLFVDNYFVPRGYTVVLAQMSGTGYNSEGCPHHGGPGDIAGLKSVIEWLNVQPWHNGSSAMIGKSYDGTLANGVAATGVAGLKTIVPESAISDWYDYSRTGGIRTSTTHYPTFLNNAIMEPKAGTGAPDRRSACTPVNNDFNTLDGDASGDRNVFWDDRDYAKNVANVKAAVFAVHGFQDDNVTMSELWPWWNGLAAAGVPRKLWLLRAGHTDPFDSRRAVWVDTLHRWFDHWLYGVDNGIMDEPRVTIEDSRDAWGQYADWPVPGTSDVDVFLRGTDPAQAGALRGGGGAAGDAVPFTGASNVPSEATYMNTPAGAQANRHVFLSRPLLRDVRLSGRAVLQLRAALDNTQSNLGVIVADYSTTPFTQVTRSNDGISSPSGPCTDWGVSSQYDDACYSEVTKPLQTVSQWRVTRGILDSSNRDSLYTPTAAAIGQPYAFTIPTEPTEHTFAAGHQIGVIVVGNLLGTAGTASTQVTVDTQLSKMVLPIVGGGAAARAAGLADEAAPTSSASPTGDWITSRTLTLSASDGDGSGVASITYSLGGGGSTTVSGDHASVTLAEGSSTIRYAATDRVGNAEAERSLTVTVDSIAPTVTLTPPKTTEFARGAVVLIGHTCADGGSGVGSCLGPDRLDTAAAGAHEAAFTAQDAAGNSGTASFRYRVLGTLPKLKLATKHGLRLALTSRVGATVRISGAHLHAKVVKLSAGVTRTVKLGAKRPGKIKLTLVTKAGALKRTEHPTVRLKR
jgi:X-Pro dipeptidyl-peptidase